MRVSDGFQDYEVNLEAVPVTVKAFKTRKSWRGTGTTYLSTIKVESANWKRVIKLAQAEVAKTAAPSVADEVIKELTEMKKLGVRVTAKQLAYPKSHEADMAEYRVSMKISDIADLVRDLT